MVDSKRNDVKLTGKEYGMLQGVIMFIYQEIDEDKVNVGTNCQVCSQ